MKHRKTLMILVMIITSAIGGWTLCERWQQRTSKSNGMVSAHDITVPKIANVPRSHRDSTPSSEEELIKHYANTNHTDDLLKEPAIQKQIHTLLGQDYSHFIENISAAQLPINLISGTLSAEGGRYDAPVREIALLCYELRTQKVHAAIFSNNELSIYTPEPEYRHLPDCMTHWIFLNINDTQIDEPPPQGNSEFQFIHKHVKAVEWTSHGLVDT